MVPRFVLLALLLASCSSNSSTEPAGDSSPETPDTISSDSNLPPEDVAATDGKVQPDLPGSPDTTQETVADLGEDTGVPPEECTGVFKVEDLDGNEVTPPAGGKEGTDWVFDPAVIRDYTLEIAPEDLLWLRDHILDEEYVPASLVVDGLRYRGVAARYKGDWTSLYSCVDETTGKPTCPKLSMKLRFNKYDPCGRFRGQRRLVFNANINDYSMLRERLSYTMMGRLGMKASQVTHSRLRINDEPYSLFTQVEALDREWLERRYDDPDGNLYKGIWPKSTAAEDYVWTLETNEEEMDVAHMVEFAKAVGSANSATFTKDLAAFVSTEQIARFMAYFLATGEMDGIMWFWCHDGDCTSGNYYWYDDPASVFELLPWDREAAFFSVWDPSWLVPEWWQEPESCEPVSYYLFVDGAAKGADDPLIRPPQCDTLLRESILANPDAYLDTMQRLSVELGVVLQELPGLESQLESAINQDPNLPMSVEKWHDAVGWLQDNLEGQKEAIDTMLSNR